MQKELSKWGQFHENVAQRHKAFSQLPQKDKEAAFQAVRQAKGSAIVTVDEMLLAYEKLHSS